MARLTVDQIMTQIASTVNQEATAPTAGSAEYSLWLSYINRSYFEWAEANDWEELRKVFKPTVNGMSLASVPLPLDYRKLGGAPRLYLNGSGFEMGEEYPFAIPEEEALYQETDKYVTLTGNQNSGYALLWHPATLASGASIAIPYYSMPTSLASSTDVPVLTDSQYLVDRTIGFILEARSDPRFQSQEARAREKLLAMVENSTMEKYTNYATPNYVSNGPLRRRGFRMGRD